MDTARLTELHACYEEAKQNGKRAREERDGETGDEAWGKLIFFIFTELLQFFF